MESSEKKGGRVEINNMIITPIPITGISLLAGQVTTAKMTEIITNHLPKDKEPYSLGMTKKIKIRSKIPITRGKNPNKDQRKALSRIEGKYFHFGLTQRNEIQPVP